MRAVRFSAAAWAAVLLLAAGGGARAHDFWIQPERYAAAPGESVGLRLFIGDAFDGMPFLRDPRHIERFFVRGPGGDRDVPGEPNRLTVGRVALAAPGAWVVGYRSARTSLTLAADRFDAYLETEGFEDARRTRAERGDSAAPGRESYARSAKAILRAGAEGADPGAALGLPLEIALERCPAAGEALPVRLLLHGAPLAGARITGYAAAAPDRPVAARTDADGRAAPILPHAGVWLLRAVHMAEAAPGAEADWESEWTTLTFSVPAIGD